MRSRVCNLRGGVGGSRYFARDLDRHFGPAGNLYGTTLEGGNRGCGNEGDPSCGVVFKVDTNGNETVLYAFTGNSDGGNPSGPLVMDAAGNLYGTAAHGTLSDGMGGDGVV